MRYNIFTINGILFCQKDGEAVEMPLVSDLKNLFFGFYKIALILSIFWDNLPLDKYYIDKKFEVYDNHLSS